MRGFPQGPVDVLFASYGAGHVNMLLPVAHALKARGLRVAFLALTTAQAMLAASGLDYFGYVELDGAQARDVQAWGRELAGPEVPGAPVPYHESVAYHGLNFRDMVERLGKDGARAAYAESGRQAFLPVATMQALLGRLRPALVVSTNSPRSERALFEAARSLGIASLCLNDLFALQEFAWMCQPNYATRICVLNDNVAHFLIEKGCDPSVIVVTGNPAFDRLDAEATRLARKKLRGERGFEAEDKVILWASNVEPAIHPFTGVVGDTSLPSRVEAELRRIVAGERHLKLIVRRHPSERNEPVSGDKVSVSPRSEDLHALLHAVDLVVILASTVGLEAYLIGLPVISVDQSIFIADSPFSEMGISRGVDDLAKLHKAVIDEVAHASVQIEYKRPKLEATANVVKEIISIIQK